MNKESLVAVDHFANHFMLKPTRLMLEKGRIVEGLLVNLDNNYYYMRDARYDVTRKAKLLAIPRRTVRLVATMDGV